MNVVVLDISFEFPLYTDIEGGTKFEKKKKNISENKYKMKF